MKIYGYLAGSASKERPLALSEVTISARADEVRAMAKWLTELAGEMESGAFDHVHLADRIDGFVDSPEFIVSKAD